MVLTFGYKVVVDVELGDRGKEVLRVDCTDKNVKPKVIINVLRDAADNLEKDDILAETLEQMERHVYGVKPVPSPSEIERGNEQIRAHRARHERLVHIIKGGRV